MYIVFILSVKTKTTFFGKYFSFNFQSNELIK